MADNYRPPTAPDQPQAKPTPYKAPSKKSRKYRPPTAPDQPQAIVSREIAPTAPGEVPPSMEGFRETESRLAMQSQRLAAERERSAAGAAMVAEARASKTRTAEPTYDTGYVPSPYKPGTKPEDVEYGERPKFDQPQVHEMALKAIKYEDIMAGLSLGEGKDVDVDITPTKDPEKYVTRNIFDFITEKTADYRRALETKEAQQAIRAGIKAPTFLLPTPDVSAKDPSVRFVTGVLQAPAMIPDVAASLLLGAEHALRTKGKVVEDIPLAAGVMIGGMKHEATVDPFRFAGEMVGLPLVSKIVPHIKVDMPGEMPSAFKPKVKMPTGLTAEQQLKFKAGADIATALKTAESPISEPFRFTEVKALPEKSGELVEAWIKAHPEQDVVIAGSTAAKAQFRMARKPGDIDIYVKDVTKAGEELYSSLSKEIPPERIKLTKQPKHEAAVIEIRDTLGEFHHAVDIHQIVPEGSKLRFGMTTQDPVKIAGMKYVRAGELVQRKAESILQKQQYGKIGPKAHRKKDISDFEAFTKEMIEHSKKEAEKSILFKGRKGKKAASLEEELKIYKMYSGDLVYPTVEVARLYGKLSPAPKAIITAGGMGVYGAQYPDTTTPRKGYVPPMHPTKGYVPPPPPTGYVPLPPPTSYVSPPPRTAGYVPPPTPTNGYAPPPPPTKGYVPLPPPITGYVPPPTKKIKKFKPGDKHRKQIHRTLKETQDYAWNIANPIASLEALLGGKQSTRTTKKKKMAVQRKLKVRG